MKRIVAVVASFALRSRLPPRCAGRGTEGFEKAVKKVEASFSPAEAKPGQTVTFSVTIELNDGLPHLPHCPDRQDGRGDGERDQVPRPRRDHLRRQDRRPEGHEDEGGTGPRHRGVAVLHRHRDLHAQGGGVAEGRGRPRSGEATTFRVSVCDKDNCFPPKAVPVEATLKVLDGPAVEVEKAYAEEVKKALEK